MRKRISAILLIAFLLLPVLPLRVFASGKYVASRNSDVYHYSYCSYVSSIYESNKIWFDTAAEAEATGRRGCSRCKPSASTESPGTQTSKSQTKTYSKSDLNDAYDEGYDKGYNFGRSSGYRFGREEGFDSGYEKARADLESEYRKKVDEAASEASSKAYWMCALFGIPAAVFVGSVAMGKREQQLGSEHQKKIREHTESVRAKYNTAVIDAVLGKVKSGQVVPSDVDLRLSFTPIRGTATERYPYGSYTVFVTSGGHCYHARCNCSGANLPRHCFYLPKGFTPCRNCIRDPSAYRVPDWYLSLLETPAENPSTTKTEPKHSAQKPEPAKQKAPVLGPNTASGIRDMRFSKDAFIITFGDGKQYLYYNVPHDLGEVFAQTNNCLQFFFDRIDGIYPYMLVPD